MITTEQRTDAAVGTQLQSLRVFVDLSVEAAALRLGLDPVELSAYEAGVARPTPKTLLAMAECYAVKPSRLFDIVAASQRS